MENCIKDFFNINNPSGKLIGFKGIRIKHLKCSRSLLEKNGLIRLKRIRNPLGSW